MPPQNGLGNDHRCTAVGTNKGWPHQVRRSVNSNCDGDKRCHVEQFPGCSEFLLAPIVGNQTKVTDAMKPSWQDVQQKPTHELIGRERHGLVPWLIRVALVAVVFPFECDTALIHRHQPRVGNRHPVCVARQIGQYSLRPCKWAFGIHHPFTLAQWRQPLGKCLGVAQVSVLAKELQLARTVGLLQCLQKPAPKQA